MERAPGTVVPTLVPAAAGSTRRARHRDLPTAAGAAGVGGAPRAGRGVGQA